VQRPESEGAASAAEAGLHYSSDDAPGIRRLGSGSTFRYVDVGGKAVRDPLVIDRIRKLAIPPAYRDVWICPDPRGHIQATARDARGRKQYRYHARWRAVRDEAKYARTAAFAAALPAIRARVERDLRRAGLPREKVLAAVVRLLEATTIRVGNEAYAKENGSYGLTTLRGGHARVRGGVMRFAFRGKSNVRHAVSLDDRRLAKIVRACQDLPGQRLFSYLDDDGASHPVESDDVNAYIREIAGDEFSAKDFRTWEGTVACAMLLHDRSPIASEPERKRQIADVLKIVAARLGNTAAVCRACYVHPAILERYLATGTIGRFRPGKPRKHLTAEERFVASVIRRAT